MSTYLGFVYGRGKAPGKDAHVDSESLAEDCYQELQKLGDRTQFPPQLLILLASPAYVEDGRANELVPGIQAFFAKHYPDPDRDSIPLIGSSVAAVFFDGEVHERGAVLICLASRLLRAKVGAATDLSRDSDTAIRTLVRGLEPDTGGSVDPNARADGKLLVFLPGRLATCSTEVLHRNLSEAILYRMPITGGVSHFVPSQRAGLQFTEFGVHRDAMVAARIEYEVTVASGLGRSLHGTGVTKTIANYVKEEERIEFEDHAPPESLVGDRGFAVLGRKVDDRYYPVVRLTPCEGGCVAEEIRSVVTGEQLEVVDATSDEIVESARRSVTEPAIRIGMENPAGAIAFHCTTHYKIREAIGLHLEDGLAAMKDGLKDAPVVGGFFDGEMGMDRNGQSILDNRAGAALTFGDEMRDRAVWRRGFEAIASMSERLNQAQSSREVIELSLEMISAVGYPGAMISLVLPDGQDEWIIARGARGGRLESIASSTTCFLRGAERLAAIARGEQPPYIRDSQRTLPSKEQLVWKDGPISQYVIRLLGQSVRPSRTSNLVEHREILGLLHIDLGDRRKRPALHRTEEEVLRTLGAAVESSLVRVLGWEETRIMRALDHTRSIALGEGPVDVGLQALLEGAAKAFDVNSGYVRMLDESGHLLEMVVGIGPYYEAAKVAREKIEATYKSPTGEAFSLGQSRVVNDPTNHPSHQRLYKRYREGTDRNEDMTSALDRVGSYAVAVLRDANGKRRGTVTILAHRPWFFLKHHLRCLEALAGSLRSLADHLEKKGAADFLGQIGEGLVASTPSSDLVSRLKPVVVNFQKASRARLVSLFVWNESLRMFILYAQSGWSEDGWELIACYPGNEGWTGSVGLTDGPRYEKSLDEFKQQTGLPSQGPYRNQMFGTASSALEVEGIGLPLKAGSLLLGVLTAYRLYKPKEKREHFATTDPTVLGQAAERIAGYLSTLLLQHSEQTLKESRERREAVSKAMLDSVGTSPEMALCQQLLAEYRASKVVFYAPGDAPGDEQELRRVASSPDVRDVADDTVRRVQREGRSDELRTQLTEQQWGDTLFDATFGALVRICVPVPIDRKAVGVLDLNWPDNVKRTDHIVGEETEELAALGKMAGGVYLQRVMKRAQQEAELSAKDLKKSASRRVLAMAAVGAQAIHKCGNLNFELEGLKDDIIVGAEQSELLASIETLRLIGDRLATIMRTARDEVDADEASEGLDGLIDEVLRSFAWSDTIKYRCELPSELRVLVNHAWVRESFRNIVDNAFKAIRDKREPGRLTICAVALGTQAQIVFKDTGVGMTEQEIEAAWDGFIKSDDPDRAGVGVLLTRLMLEAQGGTLRIKSGKGAGTHVIVTLPLATEEVKHAAAASDR